METSVRLLLTLTLPLGWSPYCPQVRASEGLGQWVFAQGAPLHTDAHGCPQSGAQVRAPSSHRGHWCVWRSQPILVTCLFFKGHGGQRRVQSQLHEDRASFFLSRSATITSSSEGCREDETR